MTKMANINEKFFIFLPFDVDKELQTVVGKSKREKILMNSQPRHYGAEAEKTSK
jgi:hypothetical protein